MADAGPGGAAQRGTTIVPGEPIPTPCSHSRPTSAWLAWGHTGIPGDSARFPTGKRARPGPAPLSVAPLGAAVGTLARWAGCYTMRVEIASNHHNCANIRDTAAIPPHPAVITPVAKCEPSGARRGGDAPLRGPEQRRQRRQLQLR